MTKTRVLAALIMLIPILMVFLSLICKDSRKSSVALASVLLPMRTAVP